MTTRTSQTTVVHIISGAVVHSCRVFRFVVACSYSCPRVLQYPSIEDAHLYTVYSSICNTTSSSCGTRVAHARARCSSTCAALLDVAGGENSICLPACLVLKTVVSRTTTTTTTTTTTIADDGEIETKTSARSLQRTYPSTHSQLS
jgi:hypothetical protein